jgi:hypothetical protein
VTFVQACLAGQAQPDDIDDWVDAWHDGNSPESLQDFLGFIDEEFNTWVMTPSELHKILVQRVA